MGITDIFSVISNAFAQKIGKIQVAREASQGFIDAGPVLGKET